VIVFKQFQFLMRSRLSHAVPHTAHIDWVKAEPAGFCNGKVIDLNELTRKIDFAGFRQSPVPGFPTPDDFFLLRNGEKRGYIYDPDGWQPVFRQSIT